MYIESCLLSAVLLNPAINHSLVHQIIITLLLSAILPHIDPPAIYHSELQTNRCSYPANRCTNTFSIYSIMHPNFSKILREFEQEGFSEDSYMREIDLRGVMDSCAKKHAAAQQFDRQILRELWQNTLKNEEGDCLLLKDYIETICEAQDILREKIRRFQDKYACETNEAKRKELMVAIYSCAQDEKALSAPFRISDDQPSKIVKLSRQSLNPSDRTVTSIFAEEITLEYKLSRGLTLVAYLSFTCLIMEMINMTNKMHFLNLLTILSLLSIFALNYFDRLYMQLVFLLLLLSIAADSVWLAMKIDDYWSPSAQSWNVSMQEGFLKVIVIFTIGELIFKFMIAIVLFKYRGSPHGIRKKANFFLLQFNLDANPVRNPLTPLLRKLPKFIIG